MRTLLTSILLSFSLVGCAHIDREQALAATSYDVMTDAEIARAAIAEATGELHQVATVDADGVASGRAAFSNREERLAFDRRVDALVRQRVYGQGPTLQLVRVRCEQLQKAGWASWPGDEASRRNACEYGDASVTIHSLFKKPQLHRAFLDLMLEAAADPILAGQVKRKLVELGRSGIQPYVLAVEQWERVEGFRARPVEPEQFAAVSRE
ncbi:MAG: hypothetical protein ACOZQL_25865 [Myxococcota bacterium]